MTYTLIITSVILLVLVAALVGGLIWWVRRPVSVHRQSHSVVPLFGNDHAVVYPRVPDDQSSAAGRA